jgi:hypothetical protein
MGEILRAVLDQSCQFSNPAFYTIETPEALGPGNAVTLKGFLQMKQDRYFLVTAIGQGRWDIVLGWQDNSLAKFSLRDLRTGRLIWQTPIPQLTIGQDLQQCFTLPEYILLRPAASIQLEVETIDGAIGYFYGAQLYGIEYAP